MLFRLCVQERSVVARERTRASILAWLTSVRALRAHEDWVVALSSQTEILVLLSSELLLAVRLNTVPSNVTHSGKTTAEAAASDRAIRKHFRPDHAVAM